MRKFQVVAVCLLGNTVTIVIKMPVLFIYPLYWVLTVYAIPTLKKNGAGLSYLKQVLVMGGYDLSGQVQSTGTSHRSTMNVS